MKRICISILQENRKKCGTYTEMFICNYVIGDLGTVTEGLLKGLEDLKIRGRLETIEIIA